MLDRWFVLSSEKSYHLFQNSSRECLIEYAEYFGYQLCINVHICYIMERNFIHQLIIY